MIHRCWHSQRCCILTLALHCLCSLPPSSHLHLTQLHEAVFGGGPCTGRASSSSGVYPHGRHRYMWIHRCNSSLWNVSNTAGPHSSDGNQCSSNHDLHYLVCGEELELVGNEELERNDDVDEGLEMEGSNEGLELEGSNEGLELVGNKELEVGNKELAPAPALALAPALAPDQGAGAMDEDVVPMDEDESEDEGAHGEDEGHGEDARSCLKSRWDHAGIPPAHFLCSCSFAGPAHAEGFLDAPGPTANSPRSPCLRPLGIGSQSFLLRLANLPLALRRSDR